VLPDQRPALQFSGNQYFFNLWSCVHLSISSDRALRPFLHVASFGTWDSELFFQQWWQFCVSGKLIRPAGAVKTLLSEMRLKVLELTLSGIAKRPNPR
jgi:hypothetical protein